MIYTLPPAYSYFAGGERFMTGKSKTEVSAFTYCENNRSGNHIQRASRKMDGSGILIKVAVCCAAAAFVLVIKLISSEPYGTAAVEANDGDEQDERLGRLKFVELPGIIEVFSNRKNSYVELDASESEYISEAMMLRVKSSENGKISVNEPCKLTTVGTDSDYGAFVILNFSGDIALTIYGFDDVTAEEGQPLDEGDEIGTAAKDRIVRITAREGGRETDPTQFVFFAKAE